MSIYSVLFDGVLKMYQMSGIYISWVPHVLPAKKNRKQVEVSKERNNSHWVICYFNHFAPIYKLLIPKYIRQSLEVKLFVQDNLRIRTVLHDFAVKKVSFSTWIIDCKLLFQAISTIFLYHGTIIIYHASLYRSKTRNKETNWDTKINFDLLNVMETLIFK